MTHLKLQISHIKSHETIIFLWFSHGFPSFPSFPIVFPDGMCPVPVLEAAWFLLESKAMVDQEDGQGTNETAHEDVSIYVLSDIDYMRQWI